MSEAQAVERPHRVLVAVLVGLATLLLFVSTLTVFVQRQLLDNGAWTTASEQVIQDPVVQQSLSVYLVNQLYANVDVAAALQQRLPANLQPLAVPAAQALREPAVRAVTLMLARPRVQQLWINTSARAHRQLVNVLENKTGFGISTGNGVVTLDVAVLLQQLAKEIGLSGKRIAQIPPGTAQITLLRSSQLSAAQDAVQVTRILSRWLLILVILLYFAAAYLARGYRRVTIRTIGWSLLGVGLLLLVVRKLVGNYVVDAITSAQYRLTGHHVWLIGTSVLGDIGWACVFYGVVFVLAMVLAGGTRPALAVRRHVDPVVAHDAVITWGAAALVWLVLVLWGGTHALRTWWGVLLAAALLALGVVAFRRQAQAELTAPPEQLPTPPREKLVLT